MICVTKIFRFEAAHAIHQYPGSCANIHGHSYELHVTVKSNKTQDDFIHGLGILIDFKLLKSLVLDCAINKLDHQIILSKAYLDDAKHNFSKDELLVFDFEPTAENLLIYFKKKISLALPEHIQLLSLKLWETQDSYAEWLAG